MRQATAEVLFAESPARGKLPITIPGQYRFGEGITYPATRLRAGTLADAKAMVDAAKKAMVPPFEVSIFADPSGAFTTAAGLVACVEHQLKKHHQMELAGARVVIFGGTGPVGPLFIVLIAWLNRRKKMAS